jgi:two-component system, sensor histidine kinase and response regulator
MSDIRMTGEPSGPAGAEERGGDQAELLALRSAVATAGMGLWHMDCTSPLQILGWDQRCHELHGTEAGRFQPTLGSTLLLYRDETRSTLEDALMAASVSGDRFEVEVDCLISDGNMRRLLVVGVPEQGGRSIRGYYQDVTEKQQHLRQLYLEQSQLRALFKALPDLLFGIDAGGVLRHYYGGDCSVLTAPPETYIGKFVGDVFPFLRKQFKLELQSAMQTREVHRLEFELASTQGSRHYEARILPVDSAERNAGALLLLRDIHEQHEHTEALQRSETAAVEASRMKSQFLANMSHEIRTPLNGVVGMLELLMGTELVPEQREYGQTAMQSAQMLLDIVNDILDLSKIEANRLDLESLPFSVRAVAQEALSGVAVRAHEKGLELVGSVDPAIPSRVVGDPTRIRQILNNLLSNAIKFTAHGHVELQVAQREAGWLRVSVYDTGEGVPLDRQGEIFEPFIQADGSTTRRHGGTGLGLTICRQLVEKMGGRIWLDSQPGRGSCFSFSVRLPNYHVDNGSEDPAYETFVRDLDQPDLTPDDFRQFIQNKRVLVVDDNASCRRSLKEMLANWGMSAQVAVGPGPGLQTMRDATRRGKPFDLALIDFQMPGCDGLEFARELPPEVARVLMVTLGRPISEHLAEAHVHRVTVKPLLGPQLAAILLSLFRQMETSPARPLFTRRTEPLKILMAEDNMVNAKVVSKMLQRLGHNVVHVVNGQLAFEYLRQNPVDVVLMDVQMPVMDGFEATRRWRAVEATTSRRIPIVALTGNATASDREMCLESGMDYHLSKPIRLDLLDQMLGSLPSSS